MYQRGREIKGEFLLRRRTTSIQRLAAPFGALDRFHDIEKKKGVEKTKISTGTGKKKNKIPLHRKNLDY